MVIKHTFIYTKTSFDVMRLGDLYPDVAAKSVKQARVIFSNENREKIHDILENEKKPVSISELTRRLDIKYKAVYGHVQILKKNGIVRTKQLKDKPGKPVMVEVIL